MCHVIFFKECLRCVWFLIHIKRNNYTNAYFLFIFSYLLISKMSIFYYQVSANILPISKMYCISTTINYLLISYRYLRCLSTTTISYLLISYQLLRCISTTNYLLISYQYLSWYPQLKSIIYYYLTNI